MHYSNTNSLTHTSAITPIARRQHLRTLLPVQPASLPVQPASLQARGKLFTPSFVMSQFAQIGPGQKAAFLEAFRAAVSILRVNLRDGLILIGGTSLLSLGGTSKTEDVDVAATGPALHEFYAAAAANDPRFQKGTMEAWEYTASSGIVVPFEFLAQDTGFVPVIRAAREITGGGGKRAGLGNWPS